MNRSQRVKVYVKKSHFLCQRCYLFTLLMLVSENCRSVDQLVPKAFYLVSQCEECDLFVLKQG